jgi:DNA polymerase-1
MATSTLPAAGDAKTLYVIDVSGYVFRAYHALPPLTSERGEPTHAVLGVTTMIQKLVTDYRPPRTRASPRSARSCTKITKPRARARRPT